MNRSGRSDDVYELTVVGELGPVLRAMMQPTATICSESQTIICLRGQDGEDLVDVLDRLRSGGFEVATINTIR
jgi:hypothetical protein